MDDDNNQINFLPFHLKYRHLWIRVVANDKFIINVILWERKNVVREKKNEKEENHQMIRHN
jgi:hypothetical protein